jgi:hypothetical protein
MFLRTWWARVLKSEVAALLQSCTPERAKKGGARTRRVLEMLNTLIAVLAAVVVIVALNAFLFVGYYLPRTPNAWRKYCDVWSKSTGEWRRS